MDVKMKQEIDLSKFPFKDENENALALNFLSSVEAEKLFIETEGDDKNPYPFYFTWFEAMIDQMKEAGDVKGLSIVIRTLYDTLAVDPPEILNKIEASGFIAQFADELFADFDDIACEEYSG
jgi:hypothetical protein